MLQILFEWLEFKRNKWLMQRKCAHEYEVVARFRAGWDSDVHSDLYCPHCQKLAKRIPERKVKRWESIANIQRRYEESLRRERG